MSIYTTNGHLPLPVLYSGLLSAANTSSRVPLARWNTNALNTELNNVARNTNDLAKARELVAAGADLRSTNGGTWRHTPLHQAAYHEATEGLCHSSGALMTIAIARSHHPSISTLYHPDHIPDPAPPSPVE